MVSDDYQRWVSQQMDSSQRYRRYAELISVARPIECPACTLEQAISPKAFGMGAGDWEVNCVSCHRVSSQLLSAYSKRTRRTYHRLETLRAQFLGELKLDRITPVIDAIAAKEDRAWAEQPCECGGSFSLAAMPRCIRCREVVEPTYFHVTFELPRNDAYPEAL